MPEIITVFDHLNEQVTLTFPPQRIVSLVPSQTELLFSLGLGDRVVGITKFCVHPRSSVRDKTHIGGTKSFDFDKIDALQPDLIIGNKEENYQEGVELLKRKFPVWISDISSLDDAVRMIADVGVITGTSAKAAELTQQILMDFDRLPRRGSASLLYLIWRKPWMGAGKNTFIDDMISRNGWTNALTQLRYPELTITELKDTKPDLIFLSSEPYPFAEKHRAELLQICPEAKVVLVDGEMFSWYGSRLTLSCEYFRRLDV